MGIKSEKLLHSGNPFHEFKILHSFQKFYTILDRVDRRFLQL